MLSVHGGQLKIRLTVLLSLIKNEPALYLGCEDFYDEKAKQKKVELADSLGTNVGDKVIFTHFLLIIIFFNQGISASLL